MNFRRSSCVLVELGAGCSLFVQDEREASMSTANAKQDQAAAVAPAPGRKPWLWKKGQSGNPLGRRKGSKNRATLWALAMLEGDLVEVMGSVLASAKAGDTVAQRFLVARLMPA